MGTERRGIQPTEQPAPFSWDAFNTQADNDLPVHLKGGGTDNILYRLTMTLCLGGECKRAPPELQEASGLELEQGHVSWLRFREVQDSELASSAESSGVWAGK